MLYFFTHIRDAKIFYTRSIFKLVQFKITSPFDAQQLCSLTELN